MRSQILSLGGLCVLALATGSAGEISLTADSAAQLARQKNPELRAARSLIAEAEARRRSAGRLANPEIEMEAAGGQDFEGRVALGITQRFPITARLRFERHLSTIEAESARLEVLERERQLSAAAREAFHELAAAREAASLAERQVEIMKRLAKSLQISANEGLASNFDAGEAALIYETLEAAKESLRADCVTAGGRLASLIGLPADTVFVIPGSPTLPQALPASRLMGFRPDLRLAELAVEAGRVDVSLAKASRWDDVGVGFFVEGERFRDEPEGIEPEALAGIRLNIPIPVWQNGAGKAAEKKAAQERQQRQLEALRLSAWNQMLAAYQTMAAHYRSAKKVEGEILPAAKKQAANADASHQRGEIEIQVLFRIHERLAGIESAALEARKKFLIAQAAWLAAAGEPEKKP